MTVLPIALLSFLVMLAAILAMAVGVMAGRRPISGSCGGLNGEGGCALCSGSGRCAKQKDD